MQLEAYGGPRVWDKIAQVETCASFERYLMVYLEQARRLTFSLLPSTSKIE